MAERGQQFLSIAPGFFERLQYILGIQQALERGSDQKFEEPIPLSFLKALTFVRYYFGGIHTDLMPEFKDLDGEMENILLFSGEDILDQIGVEPDLILSAKLDRKNATVVPVCGGDRLLDEALWHEFVKRESRLIFKLEGHEYLPQDYGFLVTENESLRQFLSSDVQLRIPLYRRSRFDWDN